MGLQLPSALTEPLGWIGLRWPEADEEWLFEAGQQWIGFAEKLRGTAEGADGAAAGVWGQNEGETVDAFRAWWNAPDGPHQRLSADAQAAEAIGAAMIVFAGITLALKIQFLVQLTFLATAVAQAMAAAGPTFGASLAEIPPLIKSTQGNCQALVREALTQVQSAVVKELVERAKRLLKKVEATPAPGLGPAVLPVANQIRASQAFEAKLADDLKKTNPNFGTGKPEYRLNCNHTSQALEMRRRGNDVEAVGLQKAWLAAGSGRPLRYIEDAWGRRFTTGSQADIENAFKRAGDGARGIVYIQWNIGSAHVFNVENVGGTVRYIDGQDGRADAKGYFGRGFGTSYVRLDDLPAPRNLDGMVAPTLGSLL